MGNGKENQHGAAEQHEREHADDQHHAAELGAAGSRAGEGAEGEDERHRGDQSHRAADQEDAAEDPQKLGVHARHTTTLKRFDAAIFDFDETMIDLEPQHAAASGALCRALGADFLEYPESLRLASGRRIVDELRDLRAYFGWTQSIDELLRMRQRSFREACDTSDLELLPCVADVVRALRAQGLRLAIASSAVGGEIDAILRRLGLRDAFELIVDGSEVVHGKPDPEAYVVTARKLGVPPERCIVFEDSHVGVVAAKRAGAYCVAVRNPRAHFPQDLSAADVVLESMCRFRG